MAERTLTVRLRAVATEYHAALAAAGRATDDLAAKSDRVKSWGDQAHEVGKKMTLGLTLPILGAGVAATRVVGDFDASMREVQALTGAAASEMHLMREAAVQMGADTQFSATQAADALSQLVKGGFDARQAVEALPAVMQLAAAASLDIASAADIATNVLSVYRLEVNDLGRVNDYLAQAANSSDTDVRELGEAFKYVGPIAKGAGLSLEETTATMALMAEAGVRGSMAGTSLRGILTGLLSPSNKVAGILSELGINVVTSSGQITSMVDVIDQLKGSGATAGQIMEIFGDRAGPAMVALLEQGSDALQRYTKAIDESGGVAQELADAKMGGLNGAIEELWGSLETLAIRLGEAGLADFVTGIARAAGGLADRLGSLPPVAQAAGLTIAGIAAASGPTIWALGRMAQLYGPVVNGVQAVITKLQALNVQMAAARAAGSTTGGALLTAFGPQAAVIAGVAALAAGFLLLERSIRDTARAQTDAGSAAEALGEHAGMALSDLEALRDSEGKAIDTTQAFAEANRDAIATLRNLRTEAEQQSYLAEIGYQLVLRGASPEQALAEVQRLADHVGVDVPVTLTVSSIDDFEVQLAAVRLRAERALRLNDPGEISWDNIRNGAEGLSATATRELDAIRDAAQAEWNLGNMSNFIELLAEAEAALGGNSKAANYLADEVMKSLGKNFGFVIEEGWDLAGVLQQMADGADGASDAQQRFAAYVLDTADAMSGGLTPQNIAAVMAMDETKRKAAELGEGVAGMGSAVATAADQTGVAAGEMAESVDPVTQAWEDARDALDAYFDRLRARIDPFFGMSDAFSDNEDANLDVIAKQQELDRIRKEDPKNVWAIAKAEQDLADARQRSVETAMRVTEAASELAFAIEQQPELLEQAKFELEAWSQAGLISESTAKAMGDEFDRAAWRAAFLGRGVDGVRESIEQLNATPVNVKVQTSVADAVRGVAGGTGGLDFMPDAARRSKPGKWEGARAAGGPVWPGTWLVGEEGPELLNIGGYGHVTDAAGTASALAGLDSRHLTPAGGFSDSRIVDRLDRLERTLGAAGGNDGPMFEHYHVHGVERPQSPQQLAKDALFTKALVK